jgi:deoxyribodipyrimidine photo-lyase
MPSRLPLPAAGDVDAAVGWVRAHLHHLVAEADPGEVAASPRFRGGQTAADAALAMLDVTGYARDRNQVLPAERRGATAISPYVRHGLLLLRGVWDAVAEAPPRDRSRFRDELLWQEYARHLYARLGRDASPGHGSGHRDGGGSDQADRDGGALRSSLRGDGALRRGLRRELVGRPWAAADDPADVWDPAMACLEVTLTELVTDGYLVNQTRMWLASHWAVRAGVDWRAGEEVFFRHLLDGSRAANRSGWQWAVGTATGKPYGFSRWQVEKRAPGLCEGCALAHRCPIEAWPDDPPLVTVAEAERLRRDPDPAATAGPSSARLRAFPEAVWLTAESLGDDDPALRAHPDLPAVFVFDAPLLARLRLSGKRLVFLVESLADLTSRRDVEVFVGDPVAILQGRRLAATSTPVPGWGRRASRLELVAHHPWPWLVRPHGGSAASFSAWRRAAERADAVP